MIVPIESHAPSPSHEILHSPPLQPPVHSAGHSPPGATGGSTQAPEPVLASLLLEPDALVSAFVAAVLVPSDVSLEPVLAVDPDIPIEAVPVVELGLLLDIVVAVAVSDSLLSEPPPVAVPSSGAAHPAEIDATHARMEATEQRIGPASNTNMKAR